MAKKNNSKTVEANPIGHVIVQELSAEIKKDYLDYAMSVIVQRALPDVRDGLKPVARRILYSMWQQGLRSTAKFRKSAYVVGDVLGKYHPHSDTAVYDALARITQEFSMRHPLIQGQGNWGCFTGDTKVQLTDGRQVSFKDLVTEHAQGKRHWTFAYNHQEERIEISEIRKPRVTRKKASLVEVEIDTGQTIRCTPDHRFMLRDGKYREASLLQSGDSLMPLYLRATQVRQPKAQQWEYVDHLADHHHGRVRNHVVLNKQNKKPSNIQRLQFDEIGDAAKHYNHSVVAVRKLPIKEDVYDITVDPWHNFALATGIFVHNSIDGDSPAAMRYTEAKLHKLADEMLINIEKNTVDFTDNYDGTRREPVTLPATLPNFLINGTLGIAVGMATNVPPHNLAEVCDAAIHLIEKPSATVDDLMKFVQGPDFPTGGSIYNRKEILQAYATGKGSIVMRAVANIDEMKNGSFRIIVSEIPYLVNKATLITKIADAVKSKRIEGIKDLRDESDKSGIRVVIELKKDAFPKKILNRLFAITDLQKTFHVNMLALVDRGRQPQVLSLKEVLLEHINHRREVITRRTQFDLDRARERAHILEGLKKALDHINEVIETIKKSRTRENAHANLCKQFKLSDAQSTAILEMRLQTLAGLERKKVEDELLEKRKLIKELESILKDPKKVAAIVKTGYQELRDKYGEPRRTKVFARAVSEFSQEDLIPDESTIISVTRGGYIKRLATSTYRVQRRGGKGVRGMATKEEDIVDLLLATTTHKQLLFFTNRGRVFSTPAYEIPVTTRTAKGQALQNFLELAQNEHVTAIEAISPDQGDNDCLVMATAKGLIKKTPRQQFANIRRSGLIAINLKKDDNLEWVGNTTGHDQVLLISRLGLAVRFSESDVRPMGRTASGVRGMRLKAKDEVVAMHVIPPADNAHLQVLVITANGYGKRTPLKEYRLTRRGGSGIKTANITAKTGAIVNADIIDANQLKETDVLIISEKGQIIRVDCDGIGQRSRATQGVKVMSPTAQSGKVATFTTWNEATK